MYEEIIELVDESMQYGSKSQILLNYLREIKEKAIEGKALAKAESVNEETTV